MDTAASESPDAVLRALYEKNYTAVKHFVLKNSGDEDDAKDIYQEAFLTFWRNQEMGKFEAVHDGAIAAYILKIAKFKWIDQLRKNKISPVLLQENMPEDNWYADENISEQETIYLNRVVKYFEVLGEPCKELLHRFYYLKEKLKTIAIQFSWTEATVKNNKYRCLQKLRSTVLQAQNEEP